MSLIRTHPASPLSRAAIAGAAIALALGLGACGGEGDAAPSAETAEAAQTQDAQSAAPPSDPADASTPRDFDEIFEDKARFTSLAGDEGIEVDGEGDGRIPRASLEADIEDVFLNRFDMDITEVSCKEDMEVTKWFGMQPCDVETPETTYFGTVELIGTEGEMIEYELMFPGIDEEELDL